MGISNILCKVSNISVNISNTFIKITNISVEISNITDEISKILVKISIISIEISYMVQYPYNFKHRIYYCIFERFRVFKYHHYSVFQKNSREQGNLKNTSSYRLSLKLYKGHHNSVIFIFFGVFRIIQCVFHKKKVPYFNI